MKKSETLWIIFLHLVMFAFLPHIVSFAEKADLSGLSTIIVLFICLVGSSFVSRVCVELVEVFGWRALNRDKYKKHF